MKKVIFGILLISMIISCTSPKKIAKSEIRNELSDTSRIKHNDVYAEKDFEKLPSLLRSYFKNAGFIGKPKESNLQFFYSKGLIKMNSKSKWRKISCEHLLFSNPHVRLVYLKTNLLLIIPFEGRDKYKAGHGNMLGTLAKSIKVFDVSDKEMDQSALVTVLSEILFIPSACLLDNITWEQINRNTIKSTLVDNGLTVTGVFHFDDAGKLIQFTTDDRFEGKNAHPWMLKFEDYNNFNGLYLPSTVTATWKYPDYAFDYFIAHLKDYKYNITEKK